MEWKTIPREEVIRIVSSAINCQLFDEGQRISIISECLRSVLYQYSVADNGDFRQTVTSLRLTSAVRHKLMPLWPDITDPGNTIHPGVMSILDSLAELGDMVRLAGGKWLTAPPHAVRIDNNMAILLGGDLKKAYTTEMDTKVVGRVRLVKSVVCEGVAELWDAREWIGAPVEGNEKWSLRLLDKITTRFTDAPNDVGEAALYQRGKWINFSELPLDKMGVHLCRAFIGTSFSYFLGEFVAGRLWKMGSIESSDDARRLRFHLDIKENHPSKVKVKTSNGLAKLRLVRRLPRKESKVLLLGWRDSIHESEHSGITRYIFPKEILPIVRSAFEGLGIIWVNEST